ncbi:hypothetical protein HDG34_001204 [Paraburkholderia sp. HC6.4b]|uniref:hypothetical protein n=1 Tax=unclassified Paraburkholderia TaxID=2615204 RepID=UPI0017A4BA1C|nr:hypothetical protein [Paraburkholderia sp. HC6.4b]MBB5449678.1 hypothetical protein [Paraburkholderia sp. Kb1A]
MRGMTAARRAGSRRGDQMHYRAAACVQPVAVDGKRRARAFGEPGDVDEETSGGIKVGGDDGRVTELHDEGQQRRFRRLHCRGVTPI